MAPMIGVGVTVLVLVVSWHELLLLLLECIGDSWRRMVVAGVEGIARRSRRRVEYLWLLMAGMLAGKAVMATIDSQVLLVSRRRE